MKCVVCRTKAANRGWQPFGPTEDSRTFSTFEEPDSGYPLLPICAICEQRVQSGETPIDFTYKRFVYRVEDGLVKLLPQQDMAGRAVSKADLLGDRLVHIEATGSLYDDGAFGIQSVTLHLVSKRQIHFDGRSFGFGIGVPMKYCRWASPEQKESNSRCDTEVNDGCTEATH